MAKQQKITYDGKEHFPAPMTFLLPVEGETPRPIFQGLQDRAEMRKLIDATIEDCRKQGFDFNAIVVRRPYLDNEAWKCSSHVHWGVVERLDAYPSALDEINSWTPITVQWFTPAAHNGVATEGFFPDELYVIHSHLDMSIINGILRAQE